MGNNPPSGQRRRDGTTQTPCRVSAAARLCWPGDRRRPRRLTFV